MALQNALLTIMGVTILAIPAIGLIPAWKLGPAKSELPARLMAAWVVACILNLLTAVVPFLGLLAVVGCPMVAFGIASCVGGIAGRQAWLFGPLSSFWFMLPSILLRSQNMAVGLEFLVFTIAAGVIGGLAASGVLRYRGVSTGT